MKKPLFEVGEVVLLRSKSRPDLNGDKSILHVLGFSDQFTCPVTGKTVQHDNHYETHGYVLDDGAVDDDGICIIWAESDLRKKHNPGTMRFDELINSIKELVKV